MKKFLLFIVFLQWTPAFAGMFDLNRWNAMLNDIQTRAIKKKISSHTINEVIQPAALIPKILEKDKNQAEFKLTLDEYLTKAVNQRRITNGRLMAKKYPTLLSRTQQKYEIPPHVILAFWGMESNYGEFKAAYKLTDAFLTLIYDGRREKFFTDQLFALMKHADSNRLEIANIRGSWAGAMGHFQFIPTTLAKYGADGNLDGRIDIINNVSDAMTSAGNYLHQLGWNPKEKIVREVQLPTEFNYSLCDGKTKKNLAEWAAMGVIGVPAADMTAGLVCDAHCMENRLSPPLGGRKAAERGLSETSPPQSALLTAPPNGGGTKNTASPTAPSNEGGQAIPYCRAFLTYENFYRIKKWNSSNWYAIAIALLADELK